METPAPPPAHPPPGKGAAALLAVAVGLTSLLLAARAGGLLADAGAALGLAPTAATRALLVLVVPFLVPALAATAYAIQRWGAEEPARWRLRVFRAVMVWDAVLAAGLAASLGIGDLPARLRAGAGWLADGRVRALAPPPAPPPSLPATPAPTAPAPTGSSEAASPPTTGSLPGLPWRPPSAVLPGTAEAIRHLELYPGDVRERYERTFRNTQALWGVTKEGLKPARYAARWEDVVRKAAELTEETPRSGELGFYLGLYVAFQLLVGETVAQDLPGAEYWLERAGAREQRARLRCAGGLYPADPALAASLIRDQAANPKAHTSNRTACELDWLEQDAGGSCATPRDLEPWALRRSREGFLPCSFWILSVMQPNYPDARFATERPEHHAHVQELEAAGVRRFYAGASGKVRESRAQAAELVARTRIPPRAPTR